MLLKKMIAVCACAAAALSAAAGTLSPRAGLWENALECRAEKRPKDAAAALGEIAAQCAAENAWSEYALAVEMRADAEAAPAGGNAPLERVRALSAALADAPSDAARIFLEARLARSFAALADAPRPGTLRGNGDEERGNEAPDDVAAWSDAQLRAEAERRFENVLAQDELLKKIPFAAVAPKPIFADEAARERFAEKFGKIAGAENFEAGIFSLNDAATAEFPTLYDFIARDAEKFFLERATAEYPRLVRERKALPENIAFFAEAQTFADSVPAEGADGNALLRALQILRSRTLFHAADADKSALARVGLDRLASAFSFIENPTREQRDAYEAALKKFIADFSYFPISAEASALLADFLVAQEREPEAFDVADKAAAAFGNTKNAAACKNILERLKQETVSSENVPEVWLASAPTRFSVSAKNAERLRLRAVPADWRDYLKKEHNRPANLSAKEIRDLLDAGNAVEMTFPLKNFHDFRAHDHVVEIPAGKLAPGFYFLFFALNDHSFGDEESAGSCKFAWVGDVAAIREAQPCAEADGTLRVRAVDAVTGAPLEGARVSAWNKARWGGERLAVPEVRTDALGETVVSGLKRGRDPVVLVECERPDAAAPGGNAVHAVSLERVLFSAPEQARERRTISLFSDRAVYRPGQKISFKGILAEPRKSDGGAQVFPGKKVEVKLRPSAYGDDRVLASAEAWTNGFGSFAGTLAVPADVGLGRCVIEAECEGFENAERVPVFIEEYRRPKAELKISLGEEPQILGGRARAVVAGKAFSGEPLAGAKVRWSVSGGFGGEILAHGEGELDEAGTLKISWKTERSKLDEKFAETLSPAERRAEELQLGKFFSVAAEIVDSDGETVEGNETFRLSNASFSLEADAPEYFFLGEKSALPVFCAARAAQGTLRAGVPVSVEIFRLVEPENPDAAKTAAPARGEKIFAAEAKTAPSESAAVPAAEIPAGTLAPGRFRAVFRAVDDFGQSVFAERDFSVLDPAAEKCPIAAPFLLADSGARGAIKVGETARFVWGSGFASARAFVEIFIGKERVGAFWTDPARTQQEILVPATEAMRGKTATLRVSQMREGDFREARKTFDVDAGKTLKIERERMRTTLVPGAAEIWTFRISRADGSPATETEALAALYDVSAETLFRGGNVRRSWERIARALAAPIPQSGVPALTAENYFYRRFHFFGEEKFFPEFAPPSWSVPESGRARAVPMAAALGNAAVSAKFAAAESRAADEAGIAENAAAADVSAVPADGAETPGEDFADDFPARKNLQETAFFFPFLQTEERGELSIRFVVPEALTRWRFRLFAHDENLRAGVLDVDGILTAKDFTVRPAAPRFLREGDEIRFPAKIVNASERELSGELEIRAEFFSADGKKIDAQEKAPARQNFAVPAKSSATFFREISVPDGAAMLRFRTAAKSGDVSDGEEGALPVLPRETVITESRAALVKPGEKAALSFEIPPAGTEGAPRELAFVLDAPTNAFENALLAIPPAARQARENDSSDAIFCRFFAAALAKTLCENSPELRARIELWRIASPEKFASPLSGPEAEVSPFFPVAQSESARRESLAEYFDENAVAEELRSALAALRERLAQCGNEGWPWFPGAPDGANASITREILVGLGRLRERVSDEALKAEIGALAAGPLAAQETRLREAFRNAPETFTEETARTLYLLSLFPDEKAFPPTAPDARRHFLEAAKKPANWAKLSRAAQAQLALALFRAGEKEVPAKIVESLRQRAVTSETLGMHWNDAVPAAPFPRIAPRVSPIETQAAMIELFAEAARDAAAVESMKIWLLAQKRTHVWASARASANALFALFLENGNGERAAKIPARAFAEASVKFADASGETLVPGTFPRPPVPAEIFAKNDGDAPVFVSANRTFAQPLSAVRADAPAAGFSVEKAIFRRERGRDGNFVLEPARLKILRPRDELVVRLTIRADRDFEFVRVRDLRASGCEPGEHLSGWRGNGGLRFYAEPRDAETRFYFERLPAGTHVLEYAQRVRFSGLYLGGFAEIRSLYAPEFSAHSSAETLVSM